MVWPLLVSVTGRHCGAGADAAGVAFGAPLVFGAAAAFGAPWADAAVEWCVCGGATLRTRIVDAIGCLVDASDNDPSDAAGCALADAAGCGPDI